MFFNLNFLNVLQKCQFKLGIQNGMSTPMNLSREKGGDTLFGEHPRMFDEFSTQNDEGVVWSI